MNKFNIIYLKKKGQKAKRKYTREEQEDLKTQAESLKEQIDIKVATIESYYSTRISNCTPTSMLVNIKTVDGDQKTVHLALILLYISEMVQEMMKLIAEDNVYLGWRKEDSEVNREALRLMEDVGQGERKCCQYWRGCALRPRI